jgi:hypothetical protein
MKNQLLKKVCIICLSVLAISIAIISCEKQEERYQNGSVSLSFNFSEVLKSTEDDSLELIDAIIVSIENELSEEVLSLERLNMIRFGNQFISDPIVLVTGNYAITEFLVVDADDNVLFATPKEGSSLAGAIDDPLPIPFSIADNANLELETEVIWAPNSDPAEFGYSSFSLNILPSIEVLCAALAFDAVLNTNVLTNCEILVRNSSDTIFTDSLHAETNVIKLSAAAGIYIFELIKDGYFAFSDTLSLTELEAHTVVSNNPLLFTLFEIPDGLLLWNKLGSDYQVTNSAFGDDGSVFGSYEYRQGKYGDGFYVQDQPTSGRITFPTDVNVGGQGAIEFWYQPNYPYTSEPLYPYGHPNLLCTSTSSYPYFRFAFNPPSDDFSFTLGNADDTDRVVISYRIEFEAEQLMHIALVWDSDGINGTAETMQLYLDGVLQTPQAGNGSADNTQAISTTSITTPLYVANNTSGNRGCGGVMDNLKMFDYAKTDFSDRLRE